jgi:hypothetical protein
MFKNDPELNQALIKEFQDIINKVAEEILQLLRDSIQKEVYDAGDPSIYKRQGMDGGLMGSFDKTDATVRGQMISSKVKQYPMRMKHVPDNFIHGSNFWDETDDIRKILAEMIINGDIGSPHVGGIFGPGFWTMPRDFWTPLLEMLKDGTIDNMLESEFRFRGIRFVRV